MAAQAQEQQAQTLTATADADANANANLSPVDASISVKQQQQHDQLQQSTSLQQVKHEMNNNQAQIQGQGQVQMQPEPPSTQQQQQQQQQQTQHDQQPQHHTPSSSSMTSQPHYDATSHPPPQHVQSTMSHQQQQHPSQQRHDHQHQHQNQHPQPYQHQQPHSQPQYELPPHQSNGAPPGYAPAQQIPPPHHNPYTYNQPQQQQQQYQQPPVDTAYPSQMRYSMPLPPNHMHNQQLSGARHKKEIKRRTKTGCLTCRKRRIKCDEGHPSCRNCQKSKRECLGYDPIFKAQTGQPANIQPTPGSLPPSSESLSPHLQQTAQPHYSNVPQGYVPASSAGYAPSPATHTPMDHPYDYANTIDPALGAPQPAVQHVPPPMPPPQEEYTTILLPERNVRLITMEDVYHLDGIAPSLPNSRDLNVQPLPPPELDAIRDLYLREYAPGLDRFFETDWYGVHGLSVLMSDQEILKYFAHCLDRFRHPHSENNKGLPSIEARLIWVLARMAFMVPPGPQGPLNFLPRIEAVSHIILGTFMPPERVPPAPTTMPDPKMQPDAYAFYLQDLFWHHLSSFTTIHDDKSRPPTSGQAIANHLAGMRNILSMLENRDVLYSMAIARHFGGRMERYEADKVLVGRGGTADAEDPLNKLAVALGFLANEEVQGTTQVVQRLCGMNRRGFQLQRLDSVERVGGARGGGAQNGESVSEEVKVGNGVASSQPQVQQQQQHVPAAMAK